MLSLKTSIQRLGLRQTELARLLDVSPRTVSLWATGETALPGPVAAYLRVVHMLPPEALQKELGRISGRDKMLDEGIYGLDYKAAGADVRDGIGTGLAVLRNGKILGSDRWGGVFSGVYEFDSHREANKVHVRLQLPPEGELITGFAAGSEGARIDVAADFARAAPTTKATVDILGKAVEVTLTYLGPLPN